MATPDRTSRFIEHLPMPDDEEGEETYEVPVIAIDVLPFQTDTASGTSSMSSIRSFALRIGRLARRRLLISCPRRHMDPPELSTSVLGVQTRYQSHRTQVSFDRIPSLQEPLNIVVNSVPLYPFRSIP